MIRLKELNVISVTSTTISFELQGLEPYYLEKKYQLYVNSNYMGEVDRSVWTIKNLKPDSQYEITLKNEDTGEKSTVFQRTKPETAYINVKDFGAVGDGKRIDTFSIQSAIMACPDGGRVYFPEGVYLTYPIFLKSNITIELGKGAVLLGAKEREMYPILPGEIDSQEFSNSYLGSWEGEANDMFASLITGISVENVNIIGDGVIDGNSSFDTWWYDAKVKRIAWRPRTVYLNKCKNVLIEGITIRNSPSWTIHPLMSQNLKFINLNIENPKDAPNTDGLDPESCKDVLIAGTRFSVGDDCIAIKSGKLSVSQKLPMPSENLYIRNCLMEYGHGAVVIGSEMSGGVKNVHVENCVFKKTDRGIRIKTRRGRGKTGIIDEIHAANIKMEGVLTPFTINSFYFCDADGKTEYVWSKEKLPVDDRTPYVGNIYLKNITCIDAHVAAGYMYGLPERKIERVDMENIYVSFDLNAKPDYPEMLSFVEEMCRNGFYLNNIKNLRLKNVVVEGALTEPFTKLNIDNEIQ
ncbi:glycoside hydrolase family 28 protein [Thermoanaerobacterium aotearoense]|uniref:glycoside hydrolase family 28 protein n=1 Tax=Thermoanaerobacterium aotearoense TaxID=47490 RepID=UPI001F1CE2F1|nr:glycoside hydrolase family 28 protein [Thermoanaerobacterium aotearoense]